MDTISKVMYTYIVVGQHVEFLCVIFYNFVKTTVKYKLLLIYYLLSKGYTRGVGNYVEETELYSSTCTDTNKEIICFLERGYHHYLP